MNIDELIEKARLTGEEIQSIDPMSFMKNAIFDFWDYARKVADTATFKTFSLVVKEAGVCPECKGEGKVVEEELVGDKTWRAKILFCPSCHGTGRTEPKTIRDLINENH